MQNEEIKRALEQCSNECQECDGCPYELLGRGNLCFNILKRDALDLIKSLEAKVAELTPPVQVVRCKDCKHGQPQKRIGVICEYDQNGPIRAYTSFCSSGERREE